MNELSFTVLGPSGCGKTTLLACMNEYFRKLLPGFAAGDQETFRRLSEAYSNLQEEAGDNGREIIFSGGIKSTDMEQEYSFDIKGLRVRFYDFPGEWLNTGDADKARNFEEIEGKTGSSSVIIAVINSPYLMQYDGKYKDYAGINEIEYVIENSLAHDDNDKLILLVPVKCEKYLTSEKDTQSLKDAVKKSFARTIELAGSSSPYFGRMSISLLPVKTMGNVHLSRFEIRNGEPVQVYRRITGLPFMPENTDQPLRYAMSFILEQYRRNRSLLGRMFGYNPEDTLASIREGMKDYYGSEIIAGKELLGL